MCPHQLNRFVMFHSLHPGSKSYAAVPHISTSVPLYLMLPELADVIIDYLHDDRPALCSCGLVCRSWLPTSRFHLFSTVQLCHIDIGTGLPLICSPGSTIPPYVRHLELEEGRRDNPRWVKKALLSKSLPKFCALESLVLAHIDWADLMSVPSPRDRLICFSRCLNHLALEYVEFETMNQVLDLFSAAPSLEKLSLASVECEIQDVPQIRINPFTPKEIALAGGSLTIPLIDWLCLQPMPSVQTLNLAFIDMEQMPAISRYLKILGPKLEHLGLACSNYYQAALSKAIDLSHNISLKTISFDGLVLYANSPGPKHHMTLVVFMKTPQEIHRLDLPTLSAVFTGGSLVLSERKARLCFAVFGEVNRTAARDTITESLHDLYAQGRLEFGGCRVGTLLI
ncbi:hypothetical protein BD410DRAFT_900190 [Rickenella mellea]|uniref:F-box domain-containing protein n=1 Tax=Rickenella mellea TaxID=50990 RepID=A0A4Y7PY10_9AGAM|nr:hypothetical protein BD410DRAFT_900190 [Rickenella mellea]